MKFLFYIDENKILDKIDLFMGINDMSLDWLLRRIETPFITLVRFLAPPYLFNLEIISLIVCTFGSAILARGTLTNDTVLTALKVSFLTILN